MPLDDRGLRGRAKSLLWFILLWVLGVSGAAMLTLPFHLLVAVATST